MKKRIIIPWLIVWLSVYLGFMILEIITGKCLAVTILKYGGLVLCFLYALIYERKDAYLIFALFLTLIADMILIFDSVSEVGVLVFIFVQLAHLLRFSIIRRTSLLIPVLMVALIVVAGFLQKSIPTMFVLAMAYGVLIFTNIYEAFRWCKLDKSAASRCAFFGFILFFLCDLSVGISYITTTATLPHTVTILTSYFAWMFYLPAQVLITLSGNRKSFKRERVLDIPELKI